MSLTPIGKLGEFGLIEHLSHSVKTYQPSTLKGIGDDAAVLNNDHEVSLISTDMLVENVHFDLVFHPLKHLGYKAVSVNVSDIAAMNAIPQQILISIALSSRFTLEAIDEIYKGIHLACKDYNIDLVGGDTTSSQTGLIISVTVLGKANKKNIVYRSGAETGDILCVTGDLGAAYLGLLLLQREKRAFVQDSKMQPEFKTQGYPLASYLKPKARTDFIYLFRELNIKPKAMIDISDGLSSEILHICKASGLGVKIYEEKLPINQEVHDIIIDEFKMSPSTCILNGGDDYELLYTLSYDDYEKVKDHSEVLSIGYMLEKEQGKKIISPDGQDFDLIAQGWKHF